jgi:hypothetical protein
MPKENASIMHMPGVSDTTAMVGINNINSSGFMLKHHLG